MISNVEKEMTLTMNMTEPDALVYVAYPKWMTKFDRLCKANPAECQLIEEQTIDGRVVAKRYRVNKRLISLRSGIRKATTSNLHPKQTTVDAGSDT